ncbi:MAG: serine/threonine-protein kinase [Planctomycetota bacterium]|nr:serine/threonine-protein kinase [Planctomycetota bacterium]
MNNHEPSRPALSPEQFARVRSFFNAAMELPRAQRASFVEAQAGDDQAVRLAVMELMSAEEADDSPFDPEGEGFAREALSIDTSASMPASGLIGPFKIERLIGEGGMGQVFLASQSNPERQVALKLLRGGSRSRTLLNRFRREVRVLGRLEHPGIARIYEAGTSEGPGGAISYFAMEHVQGPRLTQHAVASNLDTPGILRLMIRIAEAVQHAHSKGVIHRDLKPANILVDESVQGGTGTHSAESLLRGAQPKILDFGVARLLEPDTQVTALTEQGLLVGTVAYMSPEQLAGDADGLDTRTDIYSMGVILYELLSGQLPHDVMGKQIAEAARMVRELEPRPLRSGSPQVRIDRDLATIVAKAMEKERDRRYPTAAAFAADLEHYLNNEPITARPASVVYQVSKFARRNRSLVTVAGIGALATLAGLAFSVYSLQREQQARKQSTKEAALSTAVRSYLIDGLLIAAAPERKGYDVKVMDVLADAAKGIHESFADHPEVEVEVRTQLAEVLTQLGKWTEAIEQWKLVREKAEATFGPESLPVIVARNRLADGMRDQQQVKEAYELAVSTMELVQRKLPPEHPARLDAVTGLGAALNAMGKQDEAMKVLQGGLDALRPGVEAPDQSILPVLSWLQACCIAKGDFAKAIDYSTQVLERSRRVHGAYHPDVLAAMSAQINLLSKNDKIDQAAALAAELPAAAERAFPPGHVRRGFCYTTAADALRSAKRFEDAEKYALAAVETFTAATDDLNWLTERSVSVLRRVYAEWPGHIDEWKRWSAAEARIRLMVANVDEAPNSVKLIQMQMGVARKLGIEGPDGDPITRLWNQPAGHPRRAAFCGNLAIVARMLNRPEYVQDGIAIMKAELPNAKDRAVAEGILAALEKP